jgi:tetratricopeptide (TPR) repeat protein
MHRRLLAMTLSIATLVIGGSAARGDRVKDAERLFDEGRRLMNAGKADEACPKFEHSQELDPGRGTLINLAACYEEVGRLVEALAVFRDVAEQSRAAGDKGRLDAASKRIAAIEARLPRLVLVVGDDAALPDGFTITVGGRAVPPEEWAGVQLDPGEVEVLVSAPGYQPMRTSIELVAGGGEVRLDLPALIAETGGGGGGGGGGGEPQERKDRTRTRIGIATAAGGGVLFATSIVLALGAKRRYDDAVRDYCGGDRDQCTEMGVTETNAARRRGNLATVIGGLGLAAIAGGVYLWLTAPMETVEVGRTTARVTPLVAPDAAGVMLTGAF